MGILERMRRIEKAVLEQETDTSGIIYQAFFQGTEEQAQERPDLFRSPRQLEEDVNIVAGWKGDTLKEVGDED